MVGTLKSTDTTFTTGTRVASTNFGVGYGCGKSGHPTGAHVHQYVRLGDQAWGNGNNRYQDGSLVPSKWNARYPTTLVNSRTISIEHHDNGGATGTDYQGIVPPEVLRASIELDRLLLRGDLAELKAAGIQFRAGTEDAMCRQLRAMPVDTNHIIDHNYIADGLKPSCWKPWADDKVGFPQAAYITALSGPDPTAPEESVKSFAVYEQPYLAVMRLGAWLYDNSDLASSSGNVQLTNRTPAQLKMGYVGTFSPDVAIIAYEPVAPDTNSSSRAMFAKMSDVVSREVYPTTTGVPESVVVAREQAAAKAGFNEGLESAETVVSHIPRR